MNMCDVRTIHLLTSTSIFAPRSLRCVKKQRLPFWKKEPALFKAWEVLFPVPVGAFSAAKSAPQVFVRSQNDAFFGHEIIKRQALLEKGNCLRPAFFVSPRDHLRRQPPFWWRDLSPPACPACPVRTLIHHAG